MAATVLVDAENVRRSTWPNVDKRELVDRCRSWAERERVSLIVVFDGEPPESGVDDVEGTTTETADDRLVELAGRIEGPVWLVTSDRELRERVRGRVDRVLGGGTFLRDMLQV